MTDRIKELLTLSEIKPTEFSAVCAHVEFNTCRIKCTFEGGGSISVWDESLGESLALRDYVHDRNHVRELVDVALEYNPVELAECVRAVAEACETSKHMNAKTEDAEYDTGFLAGVLTALAISPAQLSVAALVAIERAKGEG